MNQDVAQGWREIDSMIADAVPDHPTRIAILRKIRDVKFATDLDWQGKLIEMERRIQIALLGAEEETLG